MSDFSRQEKLVGPQGMQRLREARVAVLGIGGVGGYAAEALARAAVGAIVLVDCDVVEPSNINRQLVALSGTVGRAKVDVMRERIGQINPECDAAAKQVFITGDNIDELLADVCYVVDAVDNVSAKIAIALACSRLGIPLVSAMGAGNKLSGQFRTMDLFETQNDPLAKVMRRELKKRGVTHLRVVCSNAPAMAAVKKGEALPSISYMPGQCGLAIAGEVIRGLIGGNND